MFFLAIILLAISVKALSERVSRKDDAFHFKKEGSKNMWACDDGLSGIYVYGVWNPGDEFDLGVTMLYALHYANSTVQHTTDLHHSNEFTASYEQADVTIFHNNKIRVLGDEHYTVSGTCEDKTASWDLDYTGLVEPWFFYNSTSLGGWQEISWLVYMPRSKVTGTVFYDNQHHTLSDNCYGYHDHDWGRWEAFEITWAWLQYSNNDGVTVVAGAGREETGHSKANNLWIKIEKENLFLKFTPDMCLVNFTNFVESDIPDHKYPAHVHYIAENEDYSIDINIKILISPGIWKAAVVVFEQKSLFTGTVKDKKDGSVITMFEGIGFSEWTDYLL